MAEYIDRNLIEWYGCDFEDGSCEHRECSECSQAKCSHTQVMQIPVADVVEREEINAALRELRRIRITVLMDNGRYESDEVLGLVEEIIGLFEEI